MKKEERLASDVLEGVVKNNNADYLSLLEIKMALHERGFGILMLFFALPVAIPIPVISGLTSIPMIMFSIQMMRGMDSPWLPKWIGAKTIRRSTIAMMVEKAAPYLKKMEKLMRPRFSFVSSRGGEKLIGLFSFVFALSILLPFPLTNLIPAVGVALMALGMLSRDGVPIILGMIVGSVGIVISFMAILIGQKAVMQIIDRIF